MTAGKQVLDHRRRQHGDGRGPHGASARRPRDHRLPPHAGGDAGPRRGARSTRSRRASSLKVLRSPIEFFGDEPTSFVTDATCWTSWSLGEPDASGRRRPMPTGRHRAQMPADLVIMALGNTANPIIKDSEPRLTGRQVGHHRARPTKRRKETTLPGVYTGGDAARGGSTAITAAGDGQAAAREIIGDIDRARRRRSRSWSRARAAVHRARPAPTRPSSPRPHLSRRHRGVHGARAGHRARRPRPASSCACCRGTTGELIPLTLADWDARRRHDHLVVQGMGTTHARHQHDAGRATRSPASPGRSAARASCTGTPTTRRWCSPRAASACRRCTRSCASTCAWATT